MKTRNSGRWLVSFLSLAFAALCTSTASAANIPPTPIDAYTFTIAEDLALVKNPSDMNAAMMAAWNTTAGLMVARNMPYFELRNDSDTAFITQMNVGIGDTAFNFKNLTFIDASPGVSYSLLSPLHGDNLHMAFTGLAPHDVIRFQMFLAPDSALASNQMPDYRTVLFQINDSNTANNAKVSVNYSDGKTGGTAFSDYAPAMPTFTGMVFRGYEHMDTVKAFQLNAASAVPEPSGVALLATGVATAGLLVRRRKRSG